MCGIVGATAQRDITPILLEGLRRLEYRGYDSAGVAVLNPGDGIQRVRAVGKVAELESALQATPVSGTLGIAHTRWATHGEPNDINAHPHTDQDGKIALIHNGIIENYQTLRENLSAKGYRFTSDTDTETIAHVVHEMLNDGKSLLEAVQNAVTHFTGAYGTVVIDKEDPDTMVVARSGSPLVIGLGLGENFIASDQLALLPVTRRFIFLEEGDVAKVTRREVTIFDKDCKRVER